jgi:hypothetical protein
VRVFSDTRQTEIHTAGPGIDEIPAELIHTLINSVWIKEEMAEQ